MKTIVVGLPYFAKKVAFGLGCADKHNKYLAIDVSAGSLQKLLYLWHILSADVLYVIGGAASCGMTLRLAMLLNKTIIMHWVGTDVTMAAKAYELGAFDATLINKTHHLCEVHWIKEELAQIGINAKIFQIAYFDDELLSPKALSSDFAILSYVGAGREKYYGINKLIKLAYDFPLIKFKIAGISTYKEVLPSNIQLLGWVDDMESEYINCTIYLRLVDHDGLAFSVLEAMAHGRHVGYTYSFPNVNKVENYEQLNEFVGCLLSRFQANELQINDEGYKFVLAEYKRSEVMSRLSAVLCQSHCNNNA